jgi:hypothetical protein
MHRLDSALELLKSLDAFTSGAVSTKASAEAAGFTFVPCKEIARYHKPTAAPEVPQKGAREN